MLPCDDSEWMEKLCADCGRVATGTDNHHPVHELDHPYCEYGKHHAFRPTVRALKDGKPRVELIPELPMFELAKALEAGLVNGRTDDDWRPGASFRSYVGAAERHLLKWRTGEDLDTTGVSHLAHAACSLLFLLDWQLRGVGTDDRFKG